MQRNPLDARSVHFGTQMSPGQHVNPLHAHARTPLPPPPLPLSIIVANSAMVAGDFFNVKSNANFNLPQTSLFNLMDAAGVTYKGYQEGYTGGWSCNAL